MMKPMEFPEVAKARKRRRKAEESACSGITTEALEAGVVARSINANKLLVSVVDGLRSPLFKKNLPHKLARGVLDTLTERE